MMIDNLAMDIVKKAMKAYDVLDLELAIHKIRKASTSSATPAAYETAAKAFIAIEFIIKNHKSVFKYESVAVSYIYTFLLVFINHAGVDIYQCYNELFKDIIQTCNDNMSNKRAKFQDMVVEMINKNCPQKGKGM